MLQLSRQAKEIGCPISPSSGAGTAALSLLW